MCGINFTDKPMLHLRPVVDVIEAGFEEFSQLEPENCNAVFIAEHMLSGYMVYGLDDATELDGALDDAYMPDEYKKLVINRVYEAFDDLFESVGLGDAEPGCYELHRFDDMTFFVLPKPPIGYQTLQQKIFERTLKNDRLLTS